MTEFTVREIGVFRADEEGFRIVLGREYAPALAGLEGFGHLQVLWWFSAFDDEASRGTMEMQAPYRDGPKTMGVFATRSPLRPNPLALSCVEVTYIDAERAVIGIAYTDANDGSPILDIKPYTPSLDRVEAPRTPVWCAGWPQSVETGGDFDWAAVFNFE